VIEVPLNSGRYHEHAGLVAKIDDEDAERVFSRKWRVFLGNKGHLYAASGRAELMHRFILDAPRGMQVDHINGDGLDNRRANIRLATISQNLANQPSRLVWSKRATTSRYKGVTLFSRPRSKPWRATISVNRKQVSLGYFLFEEEAAKAYDEAAKLYYGDFAQLNFPE
jgi:hypothetical protein